MPDEFPYDVFLSHSAKDKAVVRPLAIHRVSATREENVEAEEEGLDSGGTVSGGSR